MYLKIKLQHTATHCNTGVFNPADSDLKSQIVHPRPANIRYSAASQRILFCKSFMGHVILQHTATNCTTLQHTCSFCTKNNTWKVVCGSFQTGGHFTLRHAGTHCNTYSAEAPCNTLQHIFSSFMKHSTFQVVCGSCDAAAYCNTSQHTATHMLFNTHALDKEIALCKSSFGHTTRQHVATYCNTLQRTCSFFRKNTAWYHSFHWKRYLPGIHQVEKLRFLGISRYKIKLRWKFECGPRNSSLSMWGISGFLQWIVW